MSSTARDMAQVVDLTLAVNYLPACACLVKVLVFALALAIIPQGEEVRGFIVLAGMLYLDRLTTRNIIFDANSILLAVFFANVHAAVRALANQHAYPVLVWGLHSCWAGMCLTLIIEPSQVKWIFDKQVKANKIIPVMLMIMVIVGTAYIQTPLENAAIRSCRALVFTLLSFAWIYVVGIHTTHGIEYLKETSCQFVARLAPVLYSPPWLATAFTPAVIGALVYQHTRRNNQNSPNSTGVDQHEAKLSMVIVHDGQQYSAVPTTAAATSNDPCQVEYPIVEDDVQELFRMAKMGRGGRMLETVQESHTQYPQIDNEWKQINI
jgi:hypothetical protein